jgi:nucleoside-diphosphate-sugar epimerase
MHRRCIADPLALHQVFNVATGRGVTVNGLAELVVEVTDRPLPIIHEDVPEGAVSSHFARRRLPQELRTLVQSPEKAGRLLGWRAETDLRRGLSAEWGWLGENSERWKEMSY